MIWYFQWVCEHPIFSHSPGVAGPSEEWNCVGFRATWVEICECELRAYVSSEAVCRDWVAEISYSGNPSPSLLPYSWMTYLNVHILWDNQVFILSCHRSPLYSYCKTNTQACLGHKLNSKYLAVVECGEGGGWEMSSISPWWGVSWHKAEWQTSAAHNEWNLQLILSLSQRWRNSKKPNWVFKTQPPCLWASITLARLGYSIPGSSEAASYFCVVELQAFLGFYIIHIAGP